MDDSRVTILMATYNGEAFIEQQLLSLLSQTYKNWILYVRDDQSTDKTVEIIEKYRIFDKRIVLVRDSLGGLGCSRNFLHLLKYSKTEFTIFCDQDDIWLENKLEILVKGIAARNNAIPQLVYSTSYTYNPAYKIGNVEIISPVTHLQSFLFRAGGIQGCAAIFNRKLGDLMSVYQGYSIMHDFTLTFLALLFGEISLINKPLTLYRIHPRNVTGDRNKTKRDVYLHFFKGNRKKGILNQYAFRTIREIVNQFEENIDPRKKEVLDAFFNFPDSGRLRMAGTVLKYGFTLYGHSFPILMKIFTRRIWEDEEKFTRK